MLPKQKDEFTRYLLTSTT